MYKLIYNIKQIKNSIINRCFINFIIFITLYFGIFFLIFSFSYIKLQLDYEKLNKIEATGRSIDFNIKENLTLTKVDLNKISTDNSNIEKITRSYMEKSELNIKGNVLYSATVYAVDNNKLETNRNYKIIKGKIYKDDINDPFNCVVNYYLVKKYLKCDIKEAIGKIININNQDYNIIGVVKNILPESNIVVFIPATTFVELLHKNSNPRYFLRFTTEIDIYNQIDSFKVYLSDNFNITIELMLYSDISRMRTDSIFSLFLTVILITTGILIYALLNISNIIVNKIQDDKKNIAIKLSMGATKNNIFLQYIIEIFLISITSSIFVMLSLTLLLNVLESFEIMPFFISFDLIIIISIILMCIIISIILSLVALCNITQKSIINILTMK